MNDTLAVILAAGLGTRMKSDRAKALHTVAGRPLAAWPVAAALDAGVKRAAVIVGHQADVVRTELTARFPEAGLEFVLQERQLGTAHATLQAESLARGFRNVLLVNGDLPLLTSGTFRAVEDAFRKSGEVFALASAIVDEPGGFGRIVRDGSGEVSAIVERRDATPEQTAIREVNLGVYLARTDLLFNLLRSIGDENAVGEFYFTDVVRLLREAGHRVGCHVLPSAAEALQVNDRVEQAEVEDVAYDRIARHWMEAGVTLRRPGTIRIDADCFIDADVEVGSGVCLHGRTRIGHGAAIGTGSILTDTEVGPGVVIKPYSVLTEAVVEADAVLGPFSHLRPGSVVRRSAHVGNFVEMKKTTLGVGSKANHLTYLGDCTVGDKVNIGAGTITCNYDGVHKFPTVIEDGAFIGSDTQLVAPVKVGKGAYIGAGTTVTRDVPDGALALSRTPQRLIEGYAERKKTKNSD
jgi:bifunctional UDP-N-acetylglucosamine pyrophosphorylase/glucosamine-1-phosphate N-acetyltransferase